ncbi:MAG: CPBP family intramembrane glutamic endopeptidase, partial [Erysipelotrichaceae bacterium]
MGLVTPVSEELLFRGYIWKRLSGIFKKERQ